MSLLGSKSEWFSGAEPEHLSQNDLDILEQHDYFMSRKGNGLRTILFLFTTTDGPAAFLWTCTNALWYNPMTFPLPTSANFSHTDTLIDGELNYIQAAPDQPPSFTYTAFDLVAIGGVSVAQRSLSTRLGILQQDIIKPRNLSVAINPNHPQPFRIEMAHHERSYAVKTTAPQIMAQRGTGLIFTPVRSKYVPNKSTAVTKIFQWSFPEFNCCSFKLHVVWDKDRKARYQILIADRQSHKYFDDFTPEPELLKEWKSSPPDGRIIDCRFDKDWDTIIFESGYAGATRKGGWRFCRFRPNKQFADEERTLRARWNSLIAPVSLEMLSERADTIRSMWKQRELKISTHLLQSPVVLPSPTKPNDLKHSATESMVSIDDYSNGAKKHRADSMISILSQSSDSRNNTEKDSEEEEEEEIEEGFVASAFAQPVASTPTLVSPNTAQKSPKFPTSNPDPASKPPLNRSNSGVVPFSNPTFQLEQIAQKTDQLRKVEPNYIPPPPVALRGALVSNPENVIINYDDPESPIEDYATVRYTAIQEKKANAAPKVSVELVVDIPMQTPDSSPKILPPTSPNSASSEGRKKNSLLFLLN